MSLYTDIVQQSQAAVMAMMKGDHQSSVSFSHYALGVMQVVWQMPIEEVDLRNGSVAPSLRSVPMLEFSPSVGANAHAVPLFNSAILFEEHNERNQYNQAYSNTLAAIICYNSGLGCHRQALQEPRDSLRWIHQALSMYKTAYTLLAEFAGDDAVMMDTVDANALLVLAVLNNMAHVFALSAELDRMHECMEVMAKVSKSFGLGEEALESEDFSFFTTTSTSTSRTSFIASPAA